MQLHVATQPPPSHAVVATTTTNDVEDDLASHDGPTADLSSSSDDDARSTSSAPSHGTATTPATHPNSSIARRFFTPYTNDQLVETKLLKILNDANAPLYLFKEILDWVKAGQSFGYSFDHGHVTRTAHLRGLETMLPNEYAKPQIVNLHLPILQGQIAQIPVTRFDFTSMFLALLTDPALVGDIDLLDVNTTNPHGQF